MIFTLTKGFLVSELDKISTVSFSILTGKSIELLPVGTRIKISRSGGHIRIQTLEFVQDTVYRKIDDGLLYSCKYISSNTKVMMIRIDGHEIEYSDDTSVWELIL